MTVIMTAFNSSQTISAAVDSVMAQNYPRIELLIIDDLSSDNTIAVVESLMEKYKNHHHKIVLKRNTKNVGTYVSRNKAIRSSSGDFITGHDSDDSCLPNYVSALMGPHLSKQDGVKITAVECAGRSGKANTVFCCISQCFSKKLVEEIGYFDSVRFAADSEFYKRCKSIFGPCSVVRIKQVLYLVNRSETSLTGNSTTGLHSEPRKFYVKAYSQWHRHGEKKHLSEAFREFPLKVRPFPVHPLSVETQTCAPAITGRKHISRRDPTRLLKKIKND